MSDPIINKEFNIMKTLINEKDAKIQELQDKIKASQFNPSKYGIYILLNQVDW